MVAISVAEIRRMIKGGEWLTRGRQDMGPNTGVNVSVCKKIKYIYIFFQIDPSPLPP